jgi:hypothetical protein
VHNLTLIGGVSNGRSKESICFCEEGSALILALAIAHLRDFLFKHSEPLVAILRANRGGHIS